MISGRGERFADDYYITRDRSRITALLERFGNALGSVEARYLADRAKAVVYRSSDTEGDEVDLGTFLEKALIKDMLRLKSLELGLWLVKDNASLFDRTWIAAPPDRGIMVHTNTWASRNSSADGSFRAVPFSIEELRIARSIQTPQLPLYIRQNDSPTSLQKGSERFSRFQYFIGAARSIPDVALKIAQYCSGLEALVSTSQQELSHQVSERVAAVLHPPGDDRITTYKLVKQAYGFRSKAVHGATFKPNEVAQLKQISKGIDRVCRAVFEAYIEDTSPFREALETSDEDLNGFLIQILLGSAASTL
ncbi:HEPN domain-containing protein [Rhizobium mongolense]|nr:HEPN domain-containing protein [Rhizobium mongolense]TVZ66168.1 hypothetical protein BCL32_6523 [Rhizobium mongolense USDA 1844]